MKATIKNEVINLHSDDVTVLNGIVNWQNLSKKEQTDEGVYDVIVPTLKLDETFGALYFDDKKRLVSYKIEKVVKTAKQIISEKKAAIGVHIYSYYSELEQQQDEKWTSLYSFKLKALGEEKVEFTVVSNAGQFFGGVSLAELEKGFSENVKAMYMKLICVAIKTEWASRCVDEGILAMKENREPNYPEFPL